MKPWMILRSNLNPTENIMTSQKFGEMTFTPGLTCMNSPDKATSWNRWWNLWKMGGFNKIRGVTVLHQESMLWTKHRSIGKSTGHAFWKVQVRLLEADHTTPTLEISNVAVTSWFVLEIPSWGAPTSSDVSWIPRCGTKWEAISLKKAWKTAWRGVNTTEFWVVFCSVRVGKV